MSRIYWHTKQRTAELHGSERGQLRHLAEGPARAAWNVERGGFERTAAIMAMVPPVPDDRYGSKFNFLHAEFAAAQEQECRNKQAWAGWAPGQPHPFTDYEPQRRVKQNLDLSLRVEGIDLLVAGVRLESANVDLNTALVAGSDPVRLAAKIHGWCEQHCWVDGPDRGWVAAIIDEGLRAGLYRRGLWYSDQPDGPRDKWSDQGWGDVLTLLREHDGGPVVLSYSVTDSFPDRESAGWDATDDLWYELPDDEQWDRAMVGLREQKPWARIAPDTLTEVTFSYPVTVYDLFAADRDERIRAASQVPAEQTR